MYTRDDFLNKTVFRQLEQCKDSFEKEIMLMAAKENAKQVGITNFTKLYRAFLDSEAAPFQEPHACNCTHFTGQPLQLQAGVWEADDYGVKKHRDDEEIVACPHPIMPVARLKDLETGMEMMKVGFRRGNEPWQYIIVEKATIATPAKITDLANHGICITSENARQLMQYFNQVECINFNSLPVEMSIGHLGYIEGIGFVPYEGRVVYDGTGNCSQLTVYYSKRRISENFEKYFSSSTIHWTREGVLTRILGKKYRLTENFCRQ